MEGRQGKLEVRRRFEVAARCLLLAACCAASALPLSAQRSQPAPATQAVPSGPTAPAHGPAPARTTPDGIPIAPIVEGHATGTLTLDGVQVPLKFAYAETRRGTFDKSTEDTRVLLSDIALSDETREDDFALMTLAREGRAHAVDLLIDHTGQVISGAFYAKAFQGMISATGMHRFTREGQASHEVSGRLYMERPSTFMKVTYQYDATFRAPIPRALTAAETTAALASPPARAAEAHLAAIRQGDLAPFTATLTARAAADYAGADGAARLKQLRAEMPADTKVTAVAAARPAGAAKPPDTAILVTVEGHQDGVVIAYVFTMRAVNGAWKVDK